MSEDPEEDPEIKEDFDGSKLCSLVFMERSTRPGTLVQRVGIASGECVGRSAKWAILRLAS